MRKTRKGNLYIQILLAAACIFGTVCPVTAEEEETGEEALLFDASSYSGTEVVNYANQFLGYPYQAGSQGPDSFDCAGFVQYVFAHFGISLPWGSSYFWNSPTTYGTVIPESNAQPGDLVCWSGHVGIYVGNGQFISALWGTGITTIKVTAFIDADGVTNPSHKYIRISGATEPHEHTLKTVKAKSATCESAGNSRYYVCQGCGKYFSDSAGTKEIKKNSWVIPALGHDWDEGVITKEPTVYEEGSITYTCKRDCGATKTEAVEKLPPIEATKITLNKTSVTLTKGKSTTLKATLAPEDVTYPDVTWYADKTGVTVSEDGKVTTKASGIYKVTAETTNGLKAVCKVIVPGWVQGGSKYKYLNSDGTYTKKKWQKISGSWYYFDSNGYMATGWKKIDGTWYYLKSSGKMAYSEWYDGYWLNSNGTWTYPYKGSWHKDYIGWWFGDTSGWYARNTTVRINGKEYRFDSRGYLIN